MVAFSILKCSLTARSSPKALPLPAPETAARRCRAIPVARRGPHSSPWANPDAGTAPSEGCETRARPRRWPAPDSPGPDAVTVEVTSKGGTTIQSKTFDVIPHTPTPTATPTPTETPSPTPTLTETPYPTPTLTETPSPTPTLAEVPSPTPTLSPTPTPTPSPVPIVYCADNGSGGTETIPVEPPRTVAQIRIDMMKRATDFGYSLLEVEAYGPDTGNMNLVATGAVTATTAQDDINCRECFADKVIDSDMTTRWASHWFDPQWLEIILPEPQVVNRIVLKWETV